MVLPPALAGFLVSDLDLWRDFIAICDCGGRVAGTVSERRALDLMARKGALATGQSVEITPVAYDGWTCRSATLDLVEVDNRASLDCTALLLSKAGSVEAEVLSIGRGTDDEFNAFGNHLKGRIALVRHEYMFAAGHIHRREKWPGHFGLELLVF